MATESSALTKLLWFIALWCAGVATVLALAFVIRLAIA